MKKTMQVMIVCRRTSAYLFGLVGGLMAIPALAVDSYFNLPLEDLLKIEISSASRKIQKVQEVPAAVFVISRDDIERSGARSIPEALRLAPGVEVARIANNRWAVSIRGFNGRFANKLLVLKDGRSIYSPLFSGVLWEAEDVVLGDIERIEVIRGPSAAMWGSNAVNGVINIISRNAADTLGTDAIVSTGTDEPGSVTLRHGFELGEGHFRISAKGFDQAPSKAANGLDGNDSWKSSRVGFRGDWPGAQGGRWTLTGEAFDSRADDRLDFSRYSVNPPLINVQQANSGSHLSLRQEQPLADGGQMDWQVSVENSVVDVESMIREERQTLGGEFQRRSSMGAHELLWGASYRISRDHIELRSADVMGAVGFDRQARDWQIGSIFAHDEYDLIPDRLRLSGGLRLDYDNWSGTQPQPDIRLAWTPNEFTTWWSSLARASRTPSRTELDIPFSLAQTSVPAINFLRVPPPNDTLTAEKVTSFEVGFRHRISEKLSLDMAGFVSDYTSLISLATGVPQSFATLPVIVPMISNNDARARTHGFEVAADWQVSPHWRLQPNYSRLYLSTPRLSDLFAAAAQDQLEGRVPRHRASVRSAWTFAEGSQFDLWLKYTSRLSNPEVSAYTTLDMRYAFRIGRQAEISIVGQNLLDQRHLEFVGDYLPTQPSEIGRSLLIKGTWHF
ncbi:MAG: TonB-dependent receptor [Rhodoferax sp.]|uniref:TonB-dependent receptor plug domain-containing protein n=1 Tax=Rhodoferax sp. TaxID=50421 RepID=UPI0030166202